ncbi:MAG: hypothetical protein LBF94_00045 [Puniceicoccales bacterium]|jgi:hypothetical protein|nr:hypothetical protein [Puniceicoccales bacterium]
MDMQTVPNLSTNVAYEGRQIMFCRVLVDEGFDPDLPLCRWFFPNSKLPEGLSVYRFVKITEGFKYREIQREHPDINVGMACYLMNGRKIEKSEIFSSFIGQTSLEERVCVIFIFDENRFDERQLPELLTRIDLDFFLKARFIDAISDSYQSICNLTKDLFYMEYADLARQAEQD